MGGNAPSKRREHHSALVDGRLYLFGGHDGRKTLPGSEIFVLNVREKQWARKTASNGEALNFKGGGCVAVRGIIYSYEREGAFYRLDPKREPMKWTRIATPKEVGPFPREGSCLWAIGSRIIMFGGTTSQEIPRNRLQRGATQTGKINDELYEFVIERNGSTASWLDLELDGPRPEPRFGAAMATIDESHGIMHAGYGGHEKSLDDAFLIVLPEKRWIAIDFNPKPSHRCGHTLSPISVKRLDDEKICCLLLGGSAQSESVWILDSEESKAHQMNLGDSVSVFGHTTCCVENDDGTATVLLCGGSDSLKEGSLKQILVVLQLDDKSGYVEKREEIENSMCELYNTNIVLRDEAPELKEHKISHKRRMTAVLLELRKTVTKVKSQLAETENERKKLSEELTAQSGKTDAVQGRSGCSAQDSQDWQKRFQDEQSQHQATKRDLEEAHSEISLLRSEKNQIINNFEVELDEKDAKIRRLEALVASDKKPIAPKSITRPKPLNASERPRRATICGRPGPPKKVVEEAPLEENKRSNSGVVVAEATSNHDEEA